MQPLLRDSLSSTLNNVNNDQLSSRAGATTTTTTTTTLAAAIVTPLLPPDNRVIRSIPPWVYDVDHESNELDQKQRLLDPEAAHPAEHHYLQEATTHKAPGRRYDHLRNAEPPLIDQTMDVNQRRWIPYMLSGPHPRGAEGARIVSDEWMEENMPHLTQPWLPQDQEKMSSKPKGYWLLSPKRQRQSLGKLQRIILKNPFVPLVFRLIVLVFTLAGLGLGARVFHEANSVTRVSGISCNKRASTYMAIILDSIAVPYLIYITWDEYLSKPLGLRSATAKVSLLLIDLYFIVFYSSNLSLAFDALNDPRWACYDNEDASLQNCPNVGTICRTQKGLSGVLVVALVAWLFTFMISVLRVVERLK